jgi:hypothetical protein
VRPSQESRDDGFPGRFIHVQDPVERKLLHSVPDALDEAFDVLLVDSGSAFQCWSSERETVPGAECTDEWGSALELSQPAYPLGVRAGQWHLCLRLRSELRGEGINFEIFVAVKGISAKKLCCNLAD